MSDAVFTFSSVPAPKLRYADDALLDEARTELERRLIEQAQGVDDRVDTLQRRARWRKRWNMSGAQERRLMRRVAGEYGA